MLKNTKDNTCEQMLVKTYKIDFTYIFYIKWAKIVMHILFRRFITRV
jgi:hypothetical protein